MKKQDKKALQAKSTEDLQKLIRETYNTLSGLKLDNVQNKLQNTRSIFITRKEIAVMQTIQKYIVESKTVLFEGDGYSFEWEKEAEKRGLPNVKTTPLAYVVSGKPSSFKLFTFDTNLF